MTAAILGYVSPSTIDPLRGTLASNGITVRRLLQMAAHWHPGPGGYPLELVSTRNRRNFVFGPIEALTGLPLSDEDVLHALNQGSSGPRLTAVPAGLDRICPAALRRTGILATMLTAARSSMHRDHTAACEVAGAWAAQRAAALRVIADVHPMPIPVILVQGHRLSVDAQREAIQQARDALLAGDYAAPAPVPPAAPAAADPAPAAAPRGRGRGRARAPLRESPAPRGQPRGRPRTAPGPFRARGRGGRGCGAAPLPAPPGPLRGRGRGRGRRGRSRGQA
jgi:hypothetical protein